jgi:hypothetical protein
MLCSIATVSESKSNLQTSIVLRRTPGQRQAPCKFPEVGFVSVDSEVRSLGGHVSITTGTDNVRPLASDGALDGNGIGIAIVDSGIYGAHVAFTDHLTGRHEL